MPNYLHRTTKQYLKSVSPNSLAEPAANYIYMPDLSAVLGQPVKYWNITGDTVTLMSQSERDAVDAALSDASRDAIADQIDEVESVIRALALVLLDEVNLLRSQHGLNARTISQIKTAIRNKLGT